MLDKVKLIEDRYEELNQLMADPDVVTDHVQVTEYAQEQAELQELVDIFRARIVDVGRSDVMIEMSGTEEKIEALVDLLRPYGIREMARTGRIALARSARD